MQNIDFAPTILDITQNEVPSEMQGGSFKPLLLGKQPENWRESLYYHYYDHGIHKVGRHEGVRTARYKLIHFYTDDVWEFYDLRKDPHEVENQYGKPAYEDEIKSLKEELFQL